MQYLWLESLFRDSVHVDELSTPSSGEITRTLSYQHPHCPFGLLNAF